MSRRNKFYSYLEKFNLKKTNLWIMRSSNKDLANQMLQNFVHFYVLNIFESSVDKFLKSLYLTVGVKLKILIIYLGV